MGRFAIHGTFAHLLQYTVEIQRRFTNTFKNGLKQVPCLLKINFLKCVQYSYFSDVTARIVQNMKPVQICTGFIFGISIGCTQPFSFQLPKMGLLALSNFALCNMPWKHGHAIACILMHFTNNPRLTGCTNSQTCRDRSFI